MSSSRRASEQRTTSSDDQENDDDLHNGHTNALDAIMNECLIGAKDWAF